MAKPYAKICILLLIAAFITGFLLYKYARGVWHPFYRKLAGKKTVAQVVAALKIPEQTLAQRFHRSGADFPPQKVALLAFKREKIVELWSSDGKGYRYIHSYPILAASGTNGPKLREGDHQVPEGIYSLVGLNPNSSYHLSIKVDYPNAYDRQHAKQERRDNLGGDIFIHGKSSSVGCIALGDTAIEELFLLAARVGLENYQLITAPVDFRSQDYHPLILPELPWTEELYQRIDEALKPFQR